MYVGPESVPASKGSRLKVFSATQEQSGRQRSTAERPTHQSGEGPNIVATDTKWWYLND